MHECIFRVAHGSLHLIIYDSLVLQLRGGVIPLLELESVALLAEVEGVQSGEERHLQVHGQQVVEVLLVSRGEGVHGEVTASPRVHVSVQTALDHVEERVSHGVLSGAASRQVLEDVRFTRVVIGWGPEKNCKNVVHV